MNKFPGILAYAFIVCFVLAGCRPAEQNSVSAPTPIPENWLHAGEYDWDLVEKLSPNEHWLANVIGSGHVSTGMQTTKANDTEVILKSDSVNLETEVFDIWIRPWSWSPKSNAIATTYSTKIQAPCYDEGIIFFQIDESANTIDTFQFNPILSAAPSCARAAWSPDGNKLVVSFTMKEFYIVDLHGNLLHKVVPDLSDDATITGFFWTDFGLIYRVDDHFDSLHNEFRLVDPDQPEIYETILRSVDQYKIIGVNENTENMLLYSYDGVTENDTSKFFQYDISTGTFGTEILLEGDLVRSSYSLGDGAYIGLGLRDNNINTTFLWVYDWQTGEFTKHIQIIDLLGWREDLEGFSVATRNDFGNYEIRIIRP